MPKASASLRSKIASLMQNLVKKDEKRKRTLYPIYDNLLAQHRLRVAALSLASYQRNSASSSSSGPGYGHGSSTSTAASFFSSVPGSGTGGQRGSGRGMYP
jgi:hypothetical protein